METFSALLALCAGNSPVTGGFPSQGQWRWALVFSLIGALTNGWVNNRDGVDLRRHRAHNDITVMNQFGENIKGVHTETEPCRWSNPWYVQQTYTGLFFPWDSENRSFQNAVRFQCSYMNDTIFHAVEFVIWHNVLSLQGICNICKLRFLGYNMTKSFIIFYFVLRNGCLVNRDTNNIRKKKKKKTTAKWRFRL